MAVDLALAPGVQGVVDEAAAFEEPLVVGLGVEAALADGQEAGAERVAVELAGDVGGGVDEAADQPGAGDPVGLGALARDPLHGVPPVVVVGWAGSRTG